MCVEKSIKWRSCNWKCLMDMFSWINYGKKEIVKEDKPLVPNNHKVPNDKVPNHVLPNLKRSYSYKVPVLVKVNTVNFFLKRRVVVFLGIPSNHQYRYISLYACQLMEAEGEEECFNGIATVYAWGPGFKIGSAKTTWCLSLFENSY